MKYLQRIKNSIFEINNSSGQIGTVVIFLFLLLFCIFIGKLTALQSPILVLGLVGGLIISLILLFNTDLALSILIVSMIFSPEIPLAQLAERAVVIRIEDFLIIFMFSGTEMLAIARPIIIFKSVSSRSFILFLESSRRSPMILSA